MISSTEIMAKLEQIENIMPPPGTDSMRQLIATPDRRLAMLREFNDLMELIDELFNNCRDFLPAESHFGDSRRAHRCGAAAPRVADRR